VFDATMQRMPPAAAAGATLACKAKCTYCCHNVVMATAPEIFFAVSELRSRHDDAFIAGVAGRSDALQSTAGMRRNPCPLLHEDLCSVYAARPSVCRKHTSLAVDACLADYEGRGGDIPIRRFDQEIFECCAVALLVGMRLWDPRQGAVHELTGALRVVLRDPHAEARWLAGEGVFDEVASQSKLPGIDEHAAFLWGRFVGS
jgi:Fe-S-cluster containining protein